MLLIMTIYYLTPYLIINQHGTITLHIPLLLTLIHHHHHAFLYLKLKPLLLLHLQMKMNQTTLQPILMIVPQIYQMSPLLDQSELNMHPAIFQIMFVITLLCLQHQIHQVSCILSQLIILVVTCLKIIMHTQPLSHTTLSQSLTQNHVNLTVGNRL
jgi:hypothetical protein